MGSVGKGEPSLRGWISPIEGQVGKVGLLVAGLLWLEGQAAGADGFGPFPVRNFQPLHQLVLVMPGDRASVLPRGALDIRIELAETASVYRDQNPQTAVTMKFETLRSGLFLRYGATDRLELAVEVPALYRYRGFMEGAITATERATTGLAPARDALRNTSYAFDISKGGRTIIGDGPGSLGFGDVSLMTKYQITRETGAVPAVSIRTAVKLPTGDEDRFFGSGSPDFGLGLAVEKTVGRRWILYGNVTGVVPTGRIAGLALRPAISALVAAEYRWSDDLSFTVQFDYYSSPFHGTGTQVLDKGVTESVAGFSYRLRPRLLWQVYGVENLDFIRGSAADFTLATVVTYHFET